VVSHTKTGKVVLERAKELEGRPEPPGTMLAHVEGTSSGVTGQPAGVLETESDEPLNK